MLLKCGLRVVNFSSPHDFTFTTGEILPEVDKELAKKLLLKVVELPVKQRQSKFRTIKPDYSLTERVSDEIDLWMTFAAMKKLDVVIIPLPVMTALYKVWSEKDIVKSPFRVIRVQDRITKEIHPQLFTV